MSASENSILVVCAHPDDECIGAGGTIALHTAAGIPVDVLCLSGNGVRNPELEAACKALGVRHLYSSDRSDFDITSNLTKVIVQHIRKGHPRIIITHSPDDYNRVHALCSRIVDEAVEWASHATLFDDAHRVERIYHMEINSLISHPHVMINIDESYQQALDALTLHRSQIKKVDGFYLQLYDHRTRLRGVQAGCERAEAFRVKLPEHAGPFYPSNNVSLLF